MHANPAANRGNALAGIHFYETYKNVFYKLTLDRDVKLDVNCS